MSALGTFRTRLAVRLESVMRQSGHRRMNLPPVQKKTSTIVSSRSRTRPRANHRPACPAPFAKIFSFSSAANHFTVLRHPALTRGAYRDRHGRWVRDAMDAGDVKRRMTLRADGEVVWS